MKISIGTNFFGDNIRQDIGIDFFKTIKLNYSDIVNFYAFQRNKNEPIPNFFKRRLISRDSRDFIENSTKTSPCVKDILDGLADTDCTYFVFINSDIFIGDDFIKYILKDEWTGYACSRMDIRPITSSKDPMIPFRYEIAGFDAFVFNKEWYISKRDKFKDYLMGSIWFDTALTTILKVYGQNDPFINDFPIQLCHIHHGWGHGGDDVPENKYNTDLYTSEPKRVRESWAWYYHNILINRTPMNKFYNLFPDEKEIEINHFKKYII